MFKVWENDDAMSWMPHPIAEGVSIKKLVTKKKHEADVTCLLVSVPKGKEVPEHVHEKQVDILYPLKGKAMMWVEGGEAFDLKPGIIVRVPKGTRHKIFDVSEDLVIYDVFWPSLE